MFKSGILEYRNGRTWHNRGQGYLCGSLDATGYRVLRFSQGKRNSAIGCREHRAFWTFMKGTIPPDKVINHINGDKTDNHIENLEVLSHRENVIHGRKSANYSPTGRRRGGKLSDQDIIEIRAAALAGINQAVIGDAYSVGSRMVSQIKTGRIFATITEQSLLR